MKLGELLKEHICYFYFDISIIPFKELEIDFNSSYKYGYARVFNQEHHLNSYTFYLLGSVYDYFTEKPVKNIAEIKKQDFLFNQFLTQMPKTRGKEKWTLLDTELIKNQISLEDLPHLVSSSIPKEDNIVVRFFKNGIYAARIGIDKNYYLEETAYKNVKHLGDTEIITQFNLLTDIVAEFISRSKKNYSDAELIEKLKLITPTEEWEKLAPGDIMYKIYTRNFLYRCRKSPYCDIPKEIREKAIK